MKSTRFITDGAMLLALYSILLLLLTYVPFLSIVLIYLMPLPFILFSLKYSIKESLLMCFVAIGVTMIITKVTFIPGTIMFSTIGMAIGYQLKKERSKGEILLTSTFLYLVHIVLIYLLVQAMLNINFTNLMTTSMTESIESSKEIYSNLGVTIDEKNFDVVVDAINIIPVILPTILLMLSFVIAFLTQVLTFPFIRRLGFKTPKFKPFREFRLPLGFMWFFLITIILSFFQLNPEDFLYSAVINLTYVLNILIVVQGFAAIFYFCHKRKISKAVPILIVIASLLISSLIYIVLLIGIVSIGFFNRRKK